MEVFSYKLAALNEKASILIESISAIIDCIFNFHWHFYYYTNLINYENLNILKDLQPKKNYKVKSLF